MAVDPAALNDTAATLDTLTGSLSTLNGLSDTFGKSLTRALKSAVVQGRQLDIVLRGLALSIVNSSLTSALSPLASLIGGSIDFGMSSWLPGLVGFRSGGVFEAGRVQPFAAGGVVSSPTYFPMSGGKSGLMGEAGAEAILPLQRGPDGRLGVASGNTPAVHVTFNVTTPDVAGFARSEAQVTSLLARAVGRGRRGL
eukprot:gene23319-24726_t